MPPLLILRLRFPPLRHFRTERHCHWLPPWPYCFVAITDIAIRCWLLRRHVTLMIL